MDLWIQDPGWKKTRSGSGINISDNFSKSLETVFWVKNSLMRIQIWDQGSQIFLSLDPGSGMEKFGSGINILLPQHWKILYEKKDFFRIQKITKNFGTNPDPHPASGSISQRYRSKDPDPYQNVTDSEHCSKHTLYIFFTTYLWNIHQCPRRRIFISSELDIWGYEEKIQSPFYSIHYGRKYCAFKHWATVGKSGTIFLTAQICWRVLYSILPCTTSTC